MNINEVEEIKERIKDVPACIQIPFMAFIIRQLKKEINNE